MNWSGSNILARPYGARADRISYAPILNPVDLYMLNCSPGRPVRVKHDA